MFPVWEQAEQIPALIEAQSRRAFSLSMCAEPETVKELTIQIVVEKKDKAPELGVSFNGSWPTFDSKVTDELLYSAGHYTHHVPEHDAFNFQCDPSRIKEGWNEIRLFNSGDEVLRVVSVEIGIR